MIADLSHEITSKTPVYPGDPTVQIEEAGVVAKDGFSDHTVTFGTHVGTHIDAPAHMIDGGKQLKDYPAERFICQAVCIDVRNGFSVEAIHAAGVRPGMAVVFYTGASEYFMEEKYWHDYPVLGDACIKALKEKQVSMVGVDAASVDKAEDFPIHKALLGANILLIENLTNVESLVGQTFELIALPLKLENDGAPARVVARTED